MTVVPKLFPVFLSFCFLLKGGFGQQWLFGNGAIKYATIKEELLFDEKQALDFAQFKADAIPLLTIDYMKTDLVLAKYFRHANFNITEAIKVLKENLEFRTKWNLDTRTEEEPEDEVDLRGLFPLAKNVSDKRGRETFFISARRYNASLLISQEFGSRVRQYIFSYLERLYRKAVTVDITTKKYAAWTLFVDVHDIEILMTTNIYFVGFLEDIVQNMEKRWPGGLQLACTINIPNWAVQHIKNLGKMLSGGGKLQDYLFVFDDDDSKWMPWILANFFNKNQIPGEVWVRSKGWIYGEDKPANAGGETMHNPLGNLRISGNPFG